MSIQSIGGGPSGSPPWVAPTGGATAQETGNKTPPATESAKNAQAAPVDSGQVKAAMKDIQEAVSSRSANLQFSYDDDSNRTVVRVVDTESGEVIRQIPSEEVMAIAKSIGDMQGMLLKQKA